METFITKLHEIMLGERVDDAIGRYILSASVLGFLVHISLWVLCSMDFIAVSPEASKLLSSPLSALYTPFSILLAYEVYQLIRAIPESFSTAVGKQFEVATLLVVRDVFKRLADIEIQGEWTISSELGLVFVECLAFVVLLYTALSYQRAQTVAIASQWDKADLDLFVMGKKMVAVLLTITYLAIAVTAFTGWILMLSEGEVGVSRDIFFLDFFTCLILADILILLISYRYSADFLALVRNTGFVLATVILRVAIASPGVSAMALFVVSGAMGITILRLTENFRKMAAD